MKKSINIVARISILAIFISVAAIASAQGGYDNILKLRALSRGVAEARQMNDAEHFTALKRGEVVKLSYIDPEFSEVLYSAPMDDFALTDYSLSSDEQSILLSQGAEPIYRHSFTTRYHLKGESGTEAILQDIEATRDATISPNSRLIAYSSLNNLYIYNIDSRESRAITTDGEWNSIINGTTDWVYEEEFGFTQAYSFSPDSRKVAYLKFDESEVPLFEMMRYDNKLYNKAYSFKYPKAGDTNSAVELWVYDIESHTSHKIDVGEERDQYIPHIGYTPAGDLFYFRLNRLQNHLEVVLVEGKEQRVIYEESSPKYIERAGASTIRFIDNDRFIAKEETTTGYMHLYLYSIKKGLIGPITSGNWEVTELITADSKSAYYISTEESPLRRSIYSISLNGKQKRKISTQEGTYSVRPSRNMEYFIASFTSAEQPSETAVYNRKGEIVRVLENNEKLKAAIEADQRPTKEFFEIETERGDILNAYIVRPRDFDQSKRYPVLMTQYSGPGSQSVADRWSIDWEDALVDNGYIVVCADGRGTGYRGEEFKKLTYANLGGLEVEDQISVAHYLAKLPYIDASRIGIYGWSYGGFMALNCALKSDIFKMAIAVAPVTSWRYYDTIYTEVYNGLPQDNPEGYDNNSPINFAKNLSEKTKLLIIHGTADDNVHFQNTIEMTRALNREGKSYDMMIYPDQNHSMMPNNTRNVRNKMVDYTLQNL